MDLTLGTLVHTQLSRVTFTYAARGFCSYRPDAPPPLPSAADHGQWAMDMVDGRKMAVSCALHFERLRSVWETAEGSLITHERVPSGHLWMLLCCLVIMTNVIICCHSYVRGVGCLLTRSTGCSPKLQVPK